MVSQVPFGSRHGKGGRGRCVTSCPPKRGVGWSRDVSASDYKPAFECSGLQKCPVRAHCSDPTATRRGPAKDVPIVVVTADPNEGIRSLCLNVGATDFLYQPISMEKLFDTVGAFRKGPCRRVEAF